MDGPEGRVKKILLHPKFWLLLFVFFSSNREHRTPACQNNYTKVGEAVRYWDVFSFAVNMFLERDLRALS